MRDTKLLESFKKKIEFVTATNLQIKVIITSIMRSRDSLINLI